MVGLGAASCVLVFVLYHNLPLSPTLLFPQIKILQEVGNDVPGTGGSMTMREWQAHFSLWAAFKSPLQIGCDIRNVNDSVMDIMLNGEVININHGVFDKGALGPIK